MCVQKSEVNAWEAGKSLPTGNLIAKMDKVLGVKLPRPSKNWVSYNDVYKYFLLSNHFK